MSFWRWLWINLRGNYVCCGECGEPVFRGGNDIADWLGKRCPGCGDDLGFRKGMEMEERWKAAHPRPASPPPPSYYRPGLRDVFAVGIGDCSATQALQRVEQVKTAMCLGEAPLESAGIRKVVTEGINVESEWLGGNVTVGHASRIRQTKNPWGVHTFSG